MSDMLKTPQYAYIPLRAGAGGNGDVTAEDAVLTPATSGRTFHAHDRPTSAYRLGEEDNGCVIIFENYSTADDVNAAVNIYGYAEAGPAEFIADFSLTAGKARINDSATDLYTDTITLVSDLSDGHIKKVKITDSGNDRIAKAWFDCVGLRWVYAEVYDLTTNAIIRPMIRPF